MSLLHKRRVALTTNALIDELKQLVRLGLPSSAPDSLTDSAAVRQLKKTIQSTLEQLAPRMGRPNSFDVSPESKLTYKSLCAENEFSLGHGETRAAIALRQHVNELDLPGQLIRWTQQHKLPRSTDGIRIRQKIWALMGVAFYGDFAMGDVDQAIVSLNRLRRFIDAALPTGGQGTRARCHELQAQLFRTLGRFEQAEFHAVESQRFIERRLRRELKTHSGD